MTHNFVTTKYQEVDGIMVNSDPNRFCILSTPPEFNKKQDFADEIEILCDNLREKKSNFIYKNNLNNICHFFRDGLLLFPFNNLYAIPRSISSLMGQDLLNTNKKIISQINNHSNSKKNDFDTRVNGLIFRILLCTRNIEGIDSFSPNLLKACFSEVIIDKSFINRYMDKKRKAIRGLLKCLSIYFNNNQYLEMVELTRRGKFKSVRLDMKKDVFGEQWLKYERTFYNEKALKDKQRYEQHINLLFKALNGIQSFSLHKAYSIENVGLLSDEIYKTIKKHRKTNQAKYEAAKYIREFLEYVANQKFGIYDEVTEIYTLPQDFGIPFKASILSDFENEIGQTSRPAQSTNMALPIKFYGKLRNILTEDNFAWPKANFPSHFINWIDPKNGKEQKVWCPVFTSIVLVKLKLPLRTVQVRALDSGEGDAIKYDIIQQEWIENPSPHANYWEKIGSSITDRGILRRFIDNDVGKIYTGFYVNTNKTSDRANLHDEHSGYEIPWQNYEAIEIFAEMREWQEKYNPLTRPTEFSELKKGVFAKPSARIEKRIPPRFYLFRFPAGTAGQFYHSPPSNDNVNWFWLKLLDELERRLKAEMPEFDIEIISSRSGTGRPKGSGYTLHGLRGGTLTALAKANVPPYVLSKIIAGHANYVMTLYYIVPGPSYITEALSHAEKKVLENENAEFRQFLSDQSFEKARKLAVFNSDVFEDSWDTERRKSFFWSTVADIGFCPRAQMDCEIGGLDALAKRTVNGKSSDVFGPVPKMPDGRNDCAQCRFFVTGPPFLLALVSKWNDASAESTRISEKLNKIQSIVDQLEDEKAIAIGSGEQFERDKIIELENLEEESHAVTQLMDSIFNHMHALTSHVQKCRALIKEWIKVRNKNEKLPISLFSSEIPKISFTETSRFEAVHEIVQSSNFFKSIDSDDLERERDEFINKMLIRNRKVPILLMLSKEESKVASEALVNFLFEKVGRMQTRALMEGHETLESLGLENELDANISLFFDKPIDLSLENQQMLPELVNQV